MIMTVHYRLLSFVAFITIHCTVCEITSSLKFSKSWRSNVEVYDDISLALGDRHVRDHFPSSSLLTEAIHHQLEILHQRALGSASDVEKENPLFAFKVQHPFLSCTKYLDYNSTLSSFGDFFGHSFQPHVTLASATADKVCFVSFVEDSTALDFYLSATSLIIHLPVPDVLKLDHSILHAIDWTISQQRNSGRNLRTGESSKKFKHPILKDLTRGLPVEISYIFRPSWSSESQERSVNQLLRKLVTKSPKNVGDGIAARAEHWENFVWRASESSQDMYSPIRAQSDSPKNQMRSMDIHGRHLWEISQYSSVFSSVANLPPLQSTIDGSKSDAVFDFSDDSKAHPIRKKWSSLGEDYARLLKEQSEISYETEICNYDAIKVQHRTNNVILKLGSDFFFSAESAGACFSNLVVLLASDPGVSRIALSKPMTTLNKNARPIMQSGSLDSETYHNAGLDGTGVIVGISDTGIDEESCFFKDPKGQVTRSSALDPITDLSFRKVVQYVNYSGSGGDIVAGHGSHVAGSVAGMNPSDGSYRGMAPMAKIAFFDIMAFNAKDGDLSVPSDLSKYIFNSSYKAGARLHSNSWGGGFWYDAYCLEVDEFIYDHDDFLIFFAAGNNGMSGIGTLLSPGLSKNSVSVAASYNSRSMGDLAYFSSMGPTPDGRSKPDITAPGFSIQSAEAQLEGFSNGNCGTIKKAGTSMATPITAGTAALVLQYFKDPRFWATYCNKAYTMCAKGAFAPKGSLIKALLLHSAVPMNTYVGYPSVTLKTPPDIYQGYGRVNLENILPLKGYASNLYTLFIEQTALKPLTELTYTVTVRSTKAPLRVTISWMDPPNPEFAARVLVHDLDLLLVGPDQSVRYGNSHGEAVRDELNNNEQITVTSSTGLTVGVWTVHVQAKMLPYVPTQNFSMVITADGAVTLPASGTVPTPISPVLLQKCRGGSTFNNSNPRLSIEQSLFNQASSAGWNPSDYCTISSVYVTHSDQKAPTISSRVEVTRSHFKGKGSYSISDTCLPSGCYEASLVVGESMIPSTSTSIPKCGVYLSPMRTSQVFCVDKPVSVKDLTTQQSVSLFEEESCTPLCELVPHVSFEAILFEAGGSGWMGGYYAITPLIHFTKSRVAMYQGRAVRNISAVSAGTLEWSFFDTSRICLPLGDFYRSIRRTQSVSPEGPTRYQKENKDSEWEEEEEEDQDEEGERGREALESQAVSLTAPACYIMHLSVPDVTPMVSPLMQLAKSWTLPLAKGKTPKTGVECPYYFRENVTYAILCVSPSLGQGNITFYENNSSYIGQMPFLSPFEMYAAYTPYNASVAGTCGFSLTYSAGKGFRNITNESRIPLSADSRSPSTAPTAANSRSPSTAPTAATPGSPSTAPIKTTPGSPSTAPIAATPGSPSTARILVSPAPSSPSRLAPIPSSSSSKPSVLVTSKGNFTCLSTCTEFPGLSYFDPVDELACNFFNLYVFSLCTTFQISNGLCEIPACASTCTLKEYCYYGANTAVNCPDNRAWGYHTSPVLEEMISTCLSAQYTASRNPLGVTATKSSKITAKTGAILAGVFSAAFAFCFFGLCLFFRRPAKGMDGVRYSTLSARAKISGTAHDDTPSREKFESYDDLQEIELNSPFPPGRTAAMDSPAARHAPGTPSGSGSDTSSVADDPVVLVTHL